jgi:hypothetical protein
MEHTEIINTYHHKCSFFSYLFRYIAEYVAGFCTLVRQGEIQEAVISKQQKQASPT